MGFIIAASGWFCTYGVWYDSSRIHGREALIVGIVLDSHCAIRTVGIARVS